jgi:YebC/PmpR family DNA-binding regulatory protein
MSGHSHYATIKRQKETKDAAKGKIFSKHARAIAIAVREGGGMDPDSNYKLRVAMEAARVDNMPKANIERAIAAGSGSEAVESVTYEGFGPGGIGIIVDAATDNRNRTGQEIKNVFEKGGGSFAPGAVGHNFKEQGFILVEKGKNSDEQILKLIDLGVEEIEEGAQVLEIYTQPAEVFEKKSAIEQAGFQVKESGLVKRPKSIIPVADPEKAKKAQSLLEALAEHDDVEKVYTNGQINQ